MKRSKLILPVLCFSIGLSTSVLADFTPDYELNIGDTAHIIAPWEQDNSQANQSSNTNISESENTGGGDYALSIMG